MLNKKALAASVSAPPAIYPEDVFSTYLYQGTGATQSINNGIDLAGKGGLIWCKTRNVTNLHSLVDTARGASKWLGSSNASAQDTFTDAITSFNNNGFSLGADTIGGYVNPSGYNCVSWTFRKQPKFFDVVTYTGTGSMGLTINHNLGSVPGMIIVKKVTTTGTGWAVYHRSLGNDKIIMLNTTAASVTDNWWNDTTPTSTQFFLSSDPTVNAFGDTFVAYLFAHNAGGFGAAGTDNVISCGSFTTDGSGNATVNLGYEPQYILCKYTTTSPWYVFDVMRGFSLAAQTALFPNTSSAENTYTGTGIFPTATGFSTLGTSLFDPNATLIYMAIRRPMKVPTDATTVFSPVYGQSGAPGFRSSNFNAGMDTSFAFLTSGYNDGTNAYQNIQTRLTGTGQLQTGNTRAEVSQSYNKWDYMNGQNNTTFYSPPWGSWMFKRAPGFHDVVCFSGTGGVTTIPHNLGVVPELMITKRRASTASWQVYSAPTGATKFLNLNLTAPSDTASNRWNDTTPTASVFTIGTGFAADTYVAYLFATCPGVSKVGSYTGNGGTQAIACGFTGGARFVLIKRTDASGDWYVYDTTRGMTTTTNPYLLLNTYDAEVPTLGSVTTTTGGFTVDASILAAINTNAASYIFLAIA